MQVDMVRLIILTLIWLAVAVFCFRVYRVSVAFEKEGKGAPFVRRTGMLMTTLVAILVIFAAFATTIALFSDVGIPLTAAAGVVTFLILHRFILRFGTREQVLQEFASWLSARIREESERQAGETKLLLERQKVSLEEGIRNLERTKAALLNVMEDLNKEKLDAQAAESRVSSIIDAIADGVMTIDEVGAVSLVNPAIESWTGLRRDVLIGKPWHTAFMLVDERDAPVLDALIPASARGGHVGRRDFILKSRVRSMPVSVSIAPLTFGTREEGSVVVFRDVTVEKRIDRAKSEFISVASHQLRTPLTSMNWYVEAVLGGDFGKIPKAFVEPLRTVHVSGRRLASLINALLNVSRIEMGNLRISPTPTDLNAVCDEVVKESTKAIVEKDLKITLKHGEIPSIPLDRSLVKIVVQNLVTNAIKYTPAKGTVTITLRKDGEAVTLSVADTGVGIPEDQQGNIFKKMFRAANAVKTVPDGTGLGLYIAKSIVERFDGDLSFVSRTGKGTTFTARFPLIGAKPQEGEQTLLTEPTA